MGVDHGFEVPDLALLLGSGRQRGVAFGAQPDDIGMGDVELSPQVSDDPRLVRLAQGGRTDLSLSFYDPRAQLVEHDLHPLDLFT